MPLAPMRNLNAPQENDDFYLMSGDLQVGHIYKRASESKPDRQFLWALNGVFGGPSEMRVSGMVATFGDAQAAVQENWDKWLTWAKLQEITKRSSHQPSVSQASEPARKDSKRVRRDSNTASD
jgi:hypothetical protein